MAKQKTISGTLALDQMRQLRHSPETFELYHLTWNTKTNTTNGMRKVNSCRIRPGFPQEKIQNNPDHYLLYMDMDLNEPRACFKKLARYVAFPPEFELLKIDWFNN